eukprot:1800493-Pyramimonas_sp.AAC.1
MHTSPGPTMGLARAGAGALLGATLDLRASGLEPLASRQKIATDSFLLFSASGGAAAGPQDR